MFEKIKADSYDEGFRAGAKASEGRIKMHQYTDERGITYSTFTEYEIVMRLFNAKDTEIADLKEKLKTLDNANKKLKADFESKSSANEKVLKELEVFYLKAIGDCKTVKQVSAISNRLIKSELFAGFAKNIVNDFCKEINIPTQLVFQIGSLNDNKQTASLFISINQAIATKIKRINRKNIIKTCELLDDEQDDAVYAHVMMSEIKEMAGIEVDGKKILDAKASGLDSMSVFKSILSAYNVKQDDVLAE